MVLAVGFLLAGCRTSELEVKVTDTVINQDYIGNGVEWDPYDEAIAWGTDLSEEDWSVLMHRVHPMGMGYVRCMINSPFLYWDASSRTYDKTRNIEKLCRILQYCLDTDVPLFSERM
jgi:hypothetical protein